MSCSKVRIAAIGLGNRTCKYLRYVRENQDAVELVAVVDPDPSKMDRVREDFSLDDDRCFTSFDALAASGLCLDACIIGSPDIYHHEQAVKAMRSGWHVLLEKPMGQTPQQCRDIVDVSEETGRMVTVCYVLRYQPYFIKLKELSADPQMGRILSVRHVERLGHDRTAHTFVRGPWNMKEMNTTVFFTKCCHDVDFVLWLVGNDVKSVSSEKGTRIFTPRYAPEGAADRCVNCSIENTCPYSAVDLYLRRKDWIKGFVALPGESQEETIIRMLNESRYGRCVYNCPENDVIDRQDIVIQMHSGIKAEVIMDCTTDQTNRVTVIDCENAVISGDESSIDVTYKDQSRPSERFDFQWTRGMDMHAGADMQIVHDFIQAIKEGHLQTKTLSEDALPSHLVCFRAE
jgi:predicted dehydrogenase